MTAHALLPILRNKILSLALVCMGLLGVSVVQAAISGEDVRTEEDLRQYVAENTDRMIDRLDDLRANADSEEFYRQMEDELTNFVDFRRIAARVMARYARQASEAQRDAFVEKFKRSLFDTYAGALAQTTDFEVNVTNARFLADNNDRASVDLVVVAESGKNYSVSYSLYRNNNDQWLMENIIVEGVNIGLAFRDRFQQEMEAQRGNLQAVIDNWSGEVEVLEDEVRQGG